MPNMTFAKSSACALFLLSGAFATGFSASAKEGPDQFSNGSAGWGVAILPPQGSHFLNYTIYYHGKIQDGDGHAARLAGSSPEVSAVADAIRYVCMTSYGILGARYGFSFVTPFVHQDFRINAMGGSRSATNLGDITIAPFILSWQSGNWFAAAALEVRAPTGVYDRTGTGRFGYRTADPRKSLGAHYWSFEPVLAVTYRSAGGWEASGKFMVNFKTENTYTKYQSGDEFHVDYLLGRTVGPWGVGIGGYYLKQISDDTQGGREVTSVGYFGVSDIFDDGRRGEVFAIGPSLKYRFDVGHLLTLTWNHEVHAENRFGGDKLVAKFVLAL